jgi:hypothetical protein|tara:strand:- start:9 stop:485 length:477 start_codon:yes stop_codon:yes gene_type:complete
MFYITDLIIIGFTYLFITSFEQSLHYLSHNRKYGGHIYKWHKLHHIDYPPHRLQSEEYINTGGNILDNLFLYYILCAWLCVYFVSSTRTFAIFIIEAPLYTYSINYFHEQFHIKNSWWNKYSWFRKYRDYHLLHHKKLNINLNFFDPTFDKLRGTYLE